MVIINLMTENGVKIAKEDLHLLDYCFLGESDLTYMMVYLVLSTI